MIFEFSFLQGEIDFKLEGFEVGFGPRYFFSKKSTLIHIKYYFLC